MRETERVVGSTQERAFANPAASARAEALRGAVDRRAEAGRSTADDDEVDLLALPELEADSKRSRELTVARPPQLRTAGKPHERNLGGLEVVRV